MRYKFFWQLWHGAVARGVEIDRLGQRGNPDCPFDRPEGIIGHRFDKICSLPNITRSWTKRFRSKR